MASFVYKVVYYTVFRRDCLFFKEESINCQLKRLIMPRKYERKPESRRYAKVAMTNIKFFWFWRIDAKFIVFFQCLSIHFFKQLFMSIPPHLLGFLLFSICFFKNSLGCQSHPGPWWLCHSAIFLKISLTTSFTAFSTAFSDSTGFLFYFRWESSNLAHWNKNGTWAK